MPAPILIVDDDPAWRARLAEIAGLDGHDVETFGDGASALARLEGPGGDRFGVMILDLVMPELDGVGVLRRLSGNASRIKVIAQTTVAGSDSVTDALRAGAFDFFVKPASPERITISIRNALHLATMENQLHLARTHRADAVPFDDIVATDPAMQRALELARRAAASLQPVLIEGEPGTGRTMLARAIHGASERRHRPLAMVIGDAAVAEPFAEALKEPGPRSGTLLVREVGRLSAAAQARLMQHLQSGEADRPETRVLATTSDDLPARVRSGHFREDLYYRLSILPIRLPPLRSRPQAMEGLVSRLLERFTALQGKAVHGIEPTALALLKSRAWPGNVRELETALHRAGMRAEGARLTEADFAGPGSTRSGPELVQTAHRNLEPPVPISAEICPFDSRGEIRPLAEIEAAMIEMAIERYRGRMATVARKLGIGRSTLYRKLKELGISDGAEKMAAE